MTDNTNLEYVLIYFLFVFIIWRLMRMRGEVQLKFVWYDVWIGFFYDSGQHILYFCPLPCFVLVGYPRDWKSKGRGVESAVWITDH